MSVSAQSCAHSESSRYDGGELSGGMGVVQEQAQEADFRERMRHGAESQREQQAEADTTDQAQSSGRWQPPAASELEDESDDGGCESPG